MFSQFVSMLVLLFAFMAFDDFLTVRSCNENGTFTSFFQGQYECHKVVKE